MTQNPIRIYLQVYAGLLALLAATVAAVYINLGAFNIVLTMGIALAKAFLVVVFFMHVKASSRVVWIYAMLGVIWTSFLVGGTLTDILTRR